MNTFLWIFAALASTPACAFHVAEHMQITERAVRELITCGSLTARWSDEWTKLVENADEQEDLDLFRKWSSYSHYYNPYHGLQQRRRDSMATVTESVSALEANPHDDLSANKLIGRIIHHVQDASVPAHAVPVAHSFEDGFEVYSLAGYYSSPLSPAACPQIEAIEPVRALRANAIATLEALETPAFDGETWRSGFWRLGAAEEFGSYGEFGNAFGSLHLRSSRHLVSADKVAYNSFKQARVEAAVRATEAVILWANKVRGF